MPDAILSKQPAPPAPLGVFCFDDVIDTLPIHQVHDHAGDHAGECAAFVSLAHDLAHRSDTVVQRLVDRLLELTHAESSGLTIEESVGDDRVLRWVATAGVLAGLQGTLMPRRLSPCGDVLDRGRALFMKDPGRYYPCVRELPVPVATVLLVPFGDDTPVGTLWIIAHQPSLTFDAEHLRIVQGLAAFAASLAATTARFSALREGEKTSQARLDASEQQRSTLESWFQHAPSFVMQLRGPEHVVGMANAACQELLGARPLIGLPLAVAVPEVGAQGIRALLDAVYATARPYIGRDAPLSLDQTPPLTRHLDFIAQPITGDEGAVVGIIVQGHDVTEQHQALEHLRQADRRKDDFLAMLAHELRNPLAPIANCVQILRAGAIALDARQERAIGILERQARTMTRLVDELLDLSRIRAGKVSLELGLVSLQNVAREACEACEPLLAAKRHTMEFVAPESALLVQGDHLRLVQVTSNLLNNAAKYTPAGGHVLLELALEEEWAVLRVKDSGLGIGADLLPRVFDLFMQVEDARGHAGGGLGLGLALVKQLVEMHGGTVEASSAGLGAGTTLVVRLPALP